MDAWIPPNSEYPPPKPGEPALHRAARVGDAAAIRSLVQEGKDINELFDMGLDPGAYDRPATPLMVAAGSGDGATVETVNLLLELGADPRLMAGADSAATFAAFGLGWNYRPGGDAARLRLLLKLASPLPPDPEASNRVLCSTAGSGDAERLEVLLEHGLNARGHWDPDAARVRHQQMMDHMARYRAAQPKTGAGLPAELQSEMDESMKEIDADMFERHVSAPSPYEIPLFCAAQSGNQRCVRLLLQAGADPKVRDSSKRTALYSAGSAQVVRELVSAGLSLEETDEYGWTPLVGSLSDGEEALPRIHALIEAGADVNATHDHGYTVFMSAVGSSRQPVLLRTLIRAGANPHAVSDRGYNAFHAAIDVNFEANAEKSVRDTMGYLKELGVNIEQRNKAGHTPLARALQDGTGLEVQVLCELGANPSAVCPKHECGGEACTRADLPLLFHAAASIGVHKDVKTLALLKAGADPLVKDPQGFTTLACCVAELCANAPDYSASYTAFFEGLRTVRLDGVPMPGSRDEFVAQASKPLREYVERFASDIPVDDSWEFAQQWRDERLACMVSLCAYEGWARHQILNDLPPPQQG
ncbi:MAG: ankyrin repeat domain-containing protein [Planctomycetota bacterium]